MDNERIEEILGQHYPTDMPEGMKERVLLRATSELRSRRGRSLGLRLAFAGVILLVAFASVSDHARQVRMAAGHPTTDGQTFAMIAEHRALAGRIGGFSGGAD
jgi:hypothetical protein